MSAVTVVGAGVIGLSTGIRLAENGHSVSTVNRVGFGAGF